MEATLSDSVAGFESDSSNAEREFEIPSTSPEALVATARVLRGELKGPLAPVVQPRNDDPWSDDVVDRLDVEKDAIAFARLAASKEVKPPLAIGVFGSWGAGKSFFMRLVHLHIERLGADGPSLQAPEASSEKFHSKVVQIRFNAWHYVDTNLWASLVEHIFVELAQTTKQKSPDGGLLGALSTARALTLEAAKELVSRRQEHALAIKSFEAAAAKLEAVKLQGVNTPSVRARALAAVLADNKDKDLATSKKELSDAAKDLGITADLAQIAAVENEASELAIKGSEIAASTRGMIRYLTAGNGVWHLVLVVLLVPPLVAVALKALATTRPSLSAINAEVTGWAVAAAGVLTMARRGVGLWQQALERLDRAKQAVDSAVSARLQPLEQDAAALRAKEIAASEQAAIAEAVLRSAGERLAIASGDFHSTTGTGRLVRFVQSRASDGHYASHQGLVSTVRKDFEELSSGLTYRQSGDVGAGQDQSEDRLYDEEIRALLADNRDLLSDDDKNRLNDLLKPPEYPEKPFERIVLYIDDLDRCPADKVVEVLQAVHMLLAFPLFVVFVAVDVRWVAGSLRGQYASMFAGGAADSHRPQATDYLEKIFQLPYWLPQVDLVTGAKLFDSLVPEQTTPSWSDPDEATSGAVTRHEVVNLELDAAERTLLKLYSPHAGSSPRKLIRYVNVFRLLKAGGYLPESAGTANIDLHGLVVQLALVTAAPEHFDLWMEFARRFDAGHGGVSGLLSHLQSPQADDAFAHPDFRAGLEFFMNQAGPGSDGDRGLRPLLEYGNLVRRFSFAL